ncbi:MAG TPA: helix-turn-helix domain-containing protein [Chloroflexota bacterium]|nr:helix-turn-helix domain-containing protein [Chloroflexota bacterium]
MNHKGAPTKRTKDLIVRLCAHVSKGTPLTVACKAVGVHRSTVYDWMEKAEERGGLYAELKGRLEAAEAQSNIDLIAVVRACAIDNKDWKAAQFLLMARLPEYFNYCQGTDVTAPGYDGESAPARGGQTAPWTEHSFSLSWVSLRPHGGGRAASASAPGSARVYALRGTPRSTPMSARAPSGAR